MSDQYTLGNMGMSPEEAASGEQIHTVVGAYDQDGDGRVDTIAYDRDGDGVADKVVFDTDGDGRGRLDRARPGLRRPDRLRRRRPRR